VEENNTNRSDPKQKERPKIIGVTLILEFLLALVFLFVSTAKNGYGEGKLTASFFQD
jgi:hypothetical protein